ncbi:MAG TPA: RES domain-containing protein, partial [Bacteroidia bacterium]|nr:RES domain-containing protein [Bacteroidia bacterium]
EAICLAEYLDKAIDFSLLARNDMSFDRIYRITMADDSFREKGKIRDVKYLKYPPVELVKKQKRYNRANTFNKTVFYAASNWHIALLETKPHPGKRIIMSVWEPLTDELFNSYPISNVQVDNQSVRDATAYLKEYGKSVHPLCAEAMDLILEFLASEFVKDVQAVNPNRLEYFYSAYFSDIILGPIIADDPTATCDLILYPSVAWNHKLDNIAMSPYCLDEKMRITHVVEFEVEETYYEQKLPLEQCPAKLRFIREATWFDGDLIVWEDE